MLMLMPDDRKILLVQLVSFAEETCLSSIDVGCLRWVGVADDLCNTRDGKGLEDGR